MTPDTEPSTEQEPMTDEQLAACVTWHVKNIREYADTTYWMLRTLKEQGTIWESTLAAINLQIGAIKKNASDLEIETRKQLTRKQLTENKKD